MVGIALLFGVLFRYLGFLAVCLRKNIHLGNADRAYHTCLDSRKPHLALTRTPRGAGIRPPPLRFYIDSKKMTARSVAKFGIPVP